MKEMGVYKEIDIELQELDMDVDLNNRDDLFDLVVETKLSNVKLSRNILKVILTNVFSNDRLRSLAHNEEFDDALGWHYSDEKVGS
jgi:hypothetical protein